MKEDDYEFDFSDYGFLGLLVMTCLLMLSGVIYILIKDPFFTLLMAGFLITPFILGWITVKIYFYFQK